MLDDYFSDQIFFFVLFDEATEHFWEFLHVLCLLHKLAEIELVYFKWFLSVLIELELQLLEVTFRSFKHEIAVLAEGVEAVLRHLQEVRALKLISAGFHLLVFYVDPVLILAILEYY